MKTLADLRVGSKARVKNVPGDDELSMRIMEMGLVPGVELAMIGVAPLGDPLEFELRGYRLSLRRSEARLVEIEVL